MSNSKEDSGPVRGFSIGDAEHRNNKHLPGVKRRRVHWD